MKNSLIRKWWTGHKIDICYVICIMIAGTLLHFIYDWTGHNMFAALFGAVNESVWEHLKLFFVPAFFFTIFGYYLMGEQYPNYLWCQMKSILSGIVFIIAAYFTYSGITEQEWMWMDIGIFYLSAVFAGIVSGRCRTGACSEVPKSEKYAGAVLLVLWAMFVWFTYSVPDILVKWLPGLFLSEA